MKKFLLALLVTGVLLIGTHLPGSSLESPLGSPAAYAIADAPAHLPDLREIDPETYVVYVTKTGKKYHEGGCRYLKKSKIETTLAKARKKYDACSVCKPPQ